ncbi:MAG: hypothetical protein J6586_12170 [Snodgrassella sp.]|nr:hypothetical protein [Snodgrassella sp.]
MTLTLKTLGIFWNSQDDAVRITKRSISSVIVRIYDPLGLLAPVIVRAKIILQRVWSLKVDWDESLPANLHSKWNWYNAKLPLLNDIRFPRKTIIKSAIKIELHGFCNASEKAHGDCVYLRTFNPDGNIQTDTTTHGEIKDSSTQIANHSTT